MIRTYSPKKAELQHDWHVIDAEGRVLGRMASEIATLLKGKHKAMYAPHMAVGDFVIVVNAAKVRVTGKKFAQKVYYRHTQYPGGLRETPFETMITKHPQRVVEHAVKGMLPHNVLGRQLFRRLKVYPGPDHPHEAQIRAGEGARAQRRAARMAVEVPTVEPPQETLPESPRPRRPRRATGGAETGLPATRRTRSSRQTEEG